MTAIDTTLASLTTVKQMSYRGAPEEWSNTYFFGGAIPANDTSWKVLCDHVITAEKELYSSHTEVIRGIGHKAGDSVAVWEFDYLAAAAAVPGVLVPTSASTRQAGDAAAWIRWSTTQKTSKGKPIYLRSYFHDVYALAEGSGLTADADLLDTHQNAVYKTYGDLWVAGFTDNDGVVHKRGGPHGAIGQVAEASVYLTTRTLERRSKRPPA